MTDPVTTTASDPSVATPATEPTQTQAAVTPQTAEPTLGASGEGLQTGNEGEGGEPQLEGLSQTKPDEPSQADGGDKKEEEQQKGHESVGAPEGDYDFSEVKMPEGMELDEDLAGVFSEVAKDLDLSQSAAKTIVEKVGPAFFEAQKAHVARLGQEWLKDAYADKDMGGSNWKSTMADANKAFNSYASPKAQELLIASGLSKNPEIIRLFRDIGRATSGDSVVTGQPSAPEANPLAALYNNSHMN